MVRLKAVACLLFVSSALFAVDVSLLDLAVEFGAEFRWEPYRKIGMIGRGTTRVTFRPESDTLIVNYGEERKAGRIEIRDGELLASEATAEYLRGLFPLRQPTDGPRISWIVIDPGHGGKDPGTNHSHLIDGRIIHLVEKDIVLYVSKILKNLLEDRYSDRRIVLTRSDDRYLELEERVKIANSIELEDDSEAIIFISVHANASLNPNTYGYEVWYLPPEYGRSNLVSEELLGADPQGLGSILNRMKDEEFTVESILLAKDILNGFDESFGPDSKNLGLKEESWFVVRNAKMPSVLVELGFITNTFEAALMSNQAHLRKMARGLYNGIVEFVDEFEAKKGFTE